MNKHLHIIFTSDLWCLYMSNKRLLSQQHVNNVAKLRSENELHHQAT